MKYIDSEYLKLILQRVVEHLKEKGADKEVRVIEAGIKFLKVMERFHSVDVVRCKDCERWLKDVPGCTDAVGRCELANYMVGANGYCVYGERKDNG